MKISTFIIVLLTMCSVGLQGQCLLNPTPTSKSELDDMNCYLARRYAPVLFQYANTDPSNDPMSNWRDQPTLMNYDNDWNHLNNWENYEQVVWRVPYSYYHVFWTDELYIITYSYYYPRDWASTGNFFCNKGLSQHEGDVERAIVYVDRALNEIRGWSVSNHGSLDHFFPGIFSCIDDKLFPMGTNSDYYPGQHPMIYASPGSHALYITSEKAEDDEDTDFDSCVPDDEFVIAYVPGGSFAFTTDFPAPFNGLEWDLEGDPTLYSNSYRLIDVFGPQPNDVTGSLWDKRFLNDEDDEMMTAAECRLGGLFGNSTMPCWITNSNWANPYTTFEDQRLYCDNYCTTILNNDKPVAALPWNGAHGVHVIKELGMDHVFKCCLSDIIDGSCSGLDVSTHEYQYTYNEYLCPSYAITGRILSSNSQSTTIRFEFGSLGYRYKGPVSWSFISPPGQTPACTGCSTGSSRIQVTFPGTLNPFDNDFSISASAVSIDCGFISDTWNLPLSNLTGDDGDVFAVVPNTGDSGTDGTIPQITTTAAMQLFPNPATNFIQLEIEDMADPLLNTDGAQTANDFIDNNIFILNADSKLVQIELLNTLNETLDISTLTNGQYFMYIQSNEGATLSGKFIVQK